MTEKAFIQHCCMTKDSSFTFKMRLITVFTLLLQFQWSNGQALDANFNSLADKVLAIERLMLTPGTIDFQVAPCDFILNGINPTATDPDPSGDQTSAHWVRTVFHDFVTANVTAGTGGLDASVGFETNRAENLGETFDSQNFINRTIIGGLAEAVLSCDPNSPMIKLRAGRIDAKVAGPAGVPGPGDGLASQTAAFAKAGFSQTDMIKAVACGHSIGGVHAGDFPNIVGSQPTYGVNKNDFFDDTPFTFDNVGVQSYLNGSGKAGGPLVTTTNTNFTSDLNIFNSDHNVTIKAMAASQTAFENACFPIFEKMINTVPAGTVLSDVIGPRQWITMFAFLDLTTTGAAVYNGSIGTYSRTGSPPTAAYQYNTVGGGNTGPHNSSVGVPLSNNIDPNAFGAVRFPFFGTTTTYAFANIIDPSVTSITIQNTYTEAINQNLFIVPSLSFINGGNGPSFFITAALLSNLVPASKKLTATLFYPAGIQGTTSPTYLQLSVQLTFSKTLSPYSLFTGIVTQPTPAVPVQGGNSLAWIDVSLGTQRSAKFELGVFSPTPLRSCTKTNFVGC